jgi:hypothetical protein
MYDDTKNLSEGEEGQVIFKVPHSILKNGVVLVDTPGINDHAVLEKISIAQAKKIEPVRGGVPCGAVLRHGG